MTTELVYEQTERKSSFDAEPRSEAVDDASAAAIKRMRQYADLTHLPFLCVDATAGTVLAKSDAEGLEILPADVCEQLSSVTEPQTIHTASGLVFCALPLPDIDRSHTVAVTYVFSQSGVKPYDVVLAAAKQNWSQERLDQWLAQQPHCDAAVVRSMLLMASKSLEQEERETSLLVEIEQLSDQIEQTYEEISLLHSLTRNLQISRGPIELAEVCLNRMHALIKSGGNAIWLEEKDGNASFLVEGVLTFDELGMARLIARFEDHDWSRPLVKNHIPGTLLGADFPGLENLVIVPIAEGTHRSGWILSCNLSSGREFGTVEASLLNSIATILGTHVRNIDLYQQHDDLLLSFVRSLVQSLEARDPYTRGHSERVALIARRIGQQLNLPDEDLNDIYLSGLLHDIGKIGIDDQVLRKPGRLTPQEYEKIQQHPMIGYEILHGLKNLQKILPGVRNHHESFNGNGYPDRLKGDEIPLMARILAVADSYDAMSSNRPYRKGLSAEKIKEIFRGGAGDQWDAKVIDVYFQARDDIQRICDEYSPGNRGLLEDATADSVLR